MSLIPVCYLQALLSHVAHLQVVLNEQEPMINARDILSLIHLSQPQQPLFHMPADEVTDKTLE